MRHPIQFEFFFTGILLLFNVWWYGHRATDMLHPYFHSSCGVQPVLLLSPVSPIALIRFLEHVRVGGVPLLLITGGKWICCMDVLN